MAAVAGEHLQMGGAKLATGACPGLDCPCCAESVDSQAIPAFIGKTRGIGAYAVRRPARHRTRNTVNATAAAISTTATTKITTKAG
jgi:hypothetical protein